VRKFLEVKIKSKEDTLLYEMGVGINYNIDEYPSLGRGWLLLTVGDMSLLINANELEFVETYTEDDE
jgi:hypothetical protein